MPFILDVPTGLAGARRLREITDSTPVRLVEWKLKRSMEIGMPIRDILLQLNSYPEPTPDWAIQATDELARRYEARITPSMCKVEIPDVSNWLANKLVGADEVIAQENRRSRDNAAKVLAQVSALIAPELLGEAIVINCQARVTPWQLAGRARAHDLTVVPSYGHGETSSMLEGLVFESGRPVLSLPRRGAKLELDHLVVAWDGGRAAARALADALPLCEQAASVKLVMVTGEKDLPEAALKADILRHLSLHGIVAEPLEVPAGGADAGTALLSFCERVGSDLLIMGAYGHSRAREFVLGGATRTILRNSRLPVLLSH